MLPELGSFAIILALCFALIQSTAAFASKPTSRLSITMTATLGQFCFLGFAMLCLIASFLLNDMSVIYVREHSHQLLPLLFRIGAAWGGHEGSLLLWCLILSFWSLAFVVVSARKLEPSTASKILMVLGIISSGFLLFLFLTSNPFLRDFPQVPVIGDDLTPVLQDPGLIFHPPMLYLGYVGFAIAFAFAICALIEGKFDQDWVRVCRPWVILPWSFLSCGIVLGSWWAYRELGWGGWWFWDPVENASLLPWLAATALIHTLIVCEKRQVFKGWALLLAIVTFALSLLGTFLVRSGVLVSVHTFANDPTRGIFLLAYLGLIIGSAFILFGLRIKHFYRAPQFDIASRETLLLINSIVMLTAVATIMIGTLYPIILEALDLAKISVGEPYFNAIFVPIMLPTLLLMGCAPHVSWGQQTLAPLLKRLRLTLLLSLIIGCMGPWTLGFPFHLLTSLSIALGLWVAFSTIQYAYKRLRTQSAIDLNQWSMIIAHLGIAVFVLGVTINKSYSEERQVRLSTGDTVQIAGYQITLARLEKSARQNFQSVNAVFAVAEPHHTAETLVAEQRIYTSHDQALSKPGIVANPWRDIYIALGTDLPKGGWSVRIYYKPFVRWIWAGGFMLLAGGLLALFPRLRKRD